MPFMDPNVGGVFAKRSLKNEVKKFSEVTVWAQGVELEPFQHLSSLSMNCAPEGRSFRHRNDGNWIGIIPCYGGFFFWGWRNGQISAVELFTSYSWVRWGTQVACFCLGNSQVGFPTTPLFCPWKADKSAQEMDQVSCFFFQDFSCDNWINIIQTSQPFFCGSPGLLSAVLVGFISPKGSQLWYHLLMSNIAMENPNHKWRFIAGNIIYFYGPWLPWLC